MLGETISHYRILEKLSGGGMGVVYRAHDERLHRDVALKVLPAGTLADETARSRFRREALTLCQLNHPNIAVVHDFDSDKGVDFLVMEYVAGETLAAKVAAGPLPEEEILALGTQMAEALEEAHERDIIHRDLKPGNVMVTPKGRVKVLDFGLAKLVKPTEVAAATASLAETQAGTIMGTVPYMAPEQLQGKAVDARADLYALGVVLYEMATGRRPFPETQTTQLIAAILTQMPQPPRELNGQISQGLEAIIRKALEKSPEQRYQSAKEVLDDLGRLSVPGSMLGAQMPVAKRRWALAAVAAAGLIVALAILVGMNVGGLRDRLPHRAAGPPHIESIAVLPLENLTGDAGQEYFADGMTEELITNLAKISALKVISRTSVMHYKGTQKTIPEIARELHVDAVVEGSVQRSGPRVRIGAQLVQATTDTHLWAESYERDLGDVMALQDEVARAIAYQVEITLTPQEHARLSGARPVNSQAYEAYLRGLYRFRKPGDEDKEAAIAIFERATVLDPQFAPAHAALGEAYVYKFFARDPKKEWEERAFVEIEKALSLDPNLAEAYCARGNLVWTLANHFPHQRAVEDFRRAVALKPSLAEAHFALGHVYYHIGLLEKSLDELNVALALDPRSIDAAYRIARVHMYQQKYELALSEFERLSEAPASWKWQHAQALFYLGKQKEAVAVLEGAIKNSPRSADLASTDALLLAASGQQLKAQEQVRNAIQLGQGRSHFHHAEYTIALTYALMGKHRAALEWLRKAAEDGFPCYPVFERDPNLKSLRNEPDYARFMETLRQQWEQFSRTL